MGCGTSKPSTRDDRSGSYKPGGGTIISAGPVFENYVATHQSHSGTVHPITFDYDSDAERQPWLLQTQCATTG